MLRLENIKKDYTAGDMTVRALKGVSLNFRKSEFVAVLGPSGCGKTTLLNIIGGLDKYTGGDLFISGRSTNDYKDSDWDAYRNDSIGFVFQSYNLIPHQTILGNVELSMTLSGVGVKERRSRAQAALEAMGLGDISYKRPNQLSGGQMQRVAIARAIVNDPQIILADEPTGALDSVTSVQIMELLKQISKERLVIMVTHNQALADKYATRTITLLDGLVTGDTNPYTQEDGDRALNAEQSVQAMVQVKKEQKKAARLHKREQKKARAKTAMSFFTALNLSGRNLITKKGRTFMTSFAGSIGIIGIALVLALSNGFSIYINQMQSDTLAGFPITVSQYTVDVNTLSTQLGSGGNKEDRKEFPADGLLRVYTPQGVQFHYNKITPSFLDHLNGLDKALYNDIAYSYGISLNVLSKNYGASAVRVRTVDPMNITPSSIMGTSSGNWQELAPSRAFVEEQYEVIAGGYPQEAGEIAVIIDKYNRISSETLERIGINALDFFGTDVSLSSLIGLKYKAVINDNWYVFNNSAVLPKYHEPWSGNYNDIYDLAGNIDLEIVGILRVAPSAPMEIYNNGVVYTPKLTKLLMERNTDSQIVQKQRNSIDYSYLKGSPYIMEIISQFMGIFEGTGLQQPLSDAIMTVNDYHNGEATDAEAQQALGIISSVANIIQALPAEQSEQALTYLEGLAQTTLCAAGGGTVPVGIYIYSSNFETKEKITAHIDRYNTGKSDADRIVYLDSASILNSIMGTLIDIISYVLIGFSAVALVVSSIMIGIITYVSVVERTKEIGVLRSVGARKKDISRVFNAETVIIGFVAGAMGVLITFVLTFPISAIIKALAKGAVRTSLAVMNPLHALLLVGVSVALTLISGLIPARIAAKKNPVEALRTE